MGKQVTGPFEPVTTRPTGLRARPANDVADGLDGANDAEPDGTCRGGGEQDHEHWSLPEEREVYACRCSAFCRKLDRAERPTC